MAEPTLCHVHCSRYVQRFGVEPGFVQHSLVSRPCERKWAKLWPKPGKAVSSGSPRRATARRTAGRGPPKRYPKCAGPRAANRPLVRAARAGDRPTGPAPKNARLSAPDGIYGSDRLQCKAAHIAGLSQDHVSQLRATVGEISRSSHCFSVESRSLQIQCHVARRSNRLRPALLDRAVQARGALSCCARPPDRRARSHSRWWYR